MDKAEWDQIPDGHKFRNFRVEHRGNVLTGGCAWLVADHLLIDGSWQRRVLSEFAGWMSGDSIQALAKKFGWPVQPEPAQRSHG